ncbi:MAG: TonB-dependent receptor [Thermoanaerobaculia bacterium]
MSSRSTAAIAALLLFFILSASPATAQHAGSISGTVSATGAGPVSNARVTLVQLNRSARTSSDGSYSFASIPAGMYLLSFESTRFGSAVREVTVAGSPVTLDVELDLAVHREQIVVTASPDARAEHDTYQPTEVLSSEDLQLRMEPTLGEMLSKSPGVSSTYFGPAASRPVIRGFGGDRIRILEEGLGTGDASNVSPDHAVSYDPINAEQIEIVRGPATLLYGSNAVGGVVNVLDSRIPRTSPGVPLTGTLDLGYSSVSDGTSGALSLEGAAGEMAWHLDYHRRDTGDLEIPGPGDPDEADEFTGKLFNSALESEGGTVGASWIRDRGMLGLSYTAFDTFYGVPVHMHHDDEHEEHAVSRKRTFQEGDEHEEDVKIDMAQRRYDMRAELFEPLPFFRAVRLRAGISDYEHQELEGDQVGTLFDSRSWEARIDAPHREIGRLTGAFGVQFSNRDFEAVGDEAFVPPTTTDTAAAFVFEESMHDTARGRVHLQFGARWEGNDVEARPRNGELDGLPASRSFDGLSGSLGAVWHTSEASTVSASLSRSFRAPTAEELYSNGPHLASFTFELGNPFLDAEVGLGMDIGFKHEGSRIDSEVHVFYNDFDGYIYQDPSGAEQDELPVFRFEQDDARFHGVEAHVDVELWHAEPHHLDLELTGDWVRADLRTGEGLPRIPPMRLGVGLRYQGSRLWGLTEVRRVFEQDEVAAYEGPTGSYTMLNAAIGYRFFLGNTAHDLILRGTNLTDEFARNHVSPLKELVPMPGRDISLSYRLAF